MSIKRLPIPDAMFWDLKKISCEKGIRTSDVAVEAYQDYIEKNKHLLNQKITLKQEPMKGEVVVTATAPNCRTSSVPYPSTISTKDIDRI